MRQYHRHTLTIALTILFTSSAIAATDFAQCCTKVPVGKYLEPFQWSACHSSYNQSETNPLHLFAPPILTTRQWCQLNCASHGLFQINDTSQWVTQLTSWVLPALAMLFLCPIAEHLYPPSDGEGWRGWLDEFVFNWLDAVVQYIWILGDPASAFNGALTQMMSDVTLCMALKRPENSHRERSLIVTAMLAEQIDIDMPIVRTTFQILSGLDKAQEYSKTACRTMMAARRKFHMSITLPVVFYVGVAASIFYDASGKLGDNDTSHSLAYGIWYNWIILLSIFSNCAASHISLEAIRSSLEVILRGVVENHTWTETVSLGWDRSIGPAQPLYELAASSLLSKRKPPLLSPCPDTIRGGRAIKFQGSIEVHALALANRYFNAMKWHKWLFDRGADVCRPTNGIWRFHPFWQNHWDRPRPLARYLLCQILAWLFVLITCLCSAFVSYTTPNVGLGCRSFNHLLYAVLALAAACLRVPTVFVDAAKYPRWVLVARIAHTTVLWINAVVVLVGGSVLQFLGAFKTCWCAAGLLGGPDTLISMGANTLLAQSWARAVWVNMGYLSFGWVVVVALGALAVRLYISYTIRDAVDI